MRKAWRRMSDSVHGHLEPVLRRFDPGWDARWTAQIEGYFEFSSTVLPANKLDDGMLSSLLGDSRHFGEVWKDAQQIRELAAAIPEEDQYGFPQQGAGRWQAHLELSLRLMEARRVIRHIPALPFEAPAPPKCSLFGSFEQMGPDSLQASADFWQRAQQSRLRLRARERFSAVALCKRFAADSVLKDELQLDVNDMRFGDTATIAAATWLQKARIKSGNDWNGRWLHQKRRSEMEPEEKAPSVETWRRIQDARRQLDQPPTYYAVLKIDADHMGRWLNGSMAPQVKEVLHPKLREYFQRIDAEALNARRPVGPALHAAISEALNNFASHVAPSIVQHFDGTIIYSGGDDVLALVPAGRVMACACDLRSAFRGEGALSRGWIDLDGRRLLSMGSKATLSAGIALVHYRHDLRMAISDARDAEKEAKDGGRDRVVLKIVRRSGGITSVTLSWDQANWMQSLTDVFTGNVSDRWAYHLRRELPTLGDEELPAAAVRAEIRRLSLRIREGRAGEQFGTAAEPENWWDKYCELAQERPASLVNFTRLVLGASFIARAQDA